MGALPPEVDLVARLMAAALAGAGVGLEREVHGHPAGLRTHLLVAFGAALFTILSFEGFGQFGGTVDPSRVAAQVVTGIGFLGAGAILKEGFTIRGLTTAASLWGTAALGMAAGVGEYGLAIVGTAIVLISLWPLHPLADRLERSRRPQEVRVHLELGALEAVGTLRARLEGDKLEISRVRTRRTAAGRYDVELTLRHPPAAALYGALDRLRELEGVTVTWVEQGD